MSDVTITISADGTRESGIQISEGDRIRAGSMPDIASVPDVLGDAVRRALAAVAGPDGYQDAARRLVDRLGVNAEASR